MPKSARRGRARPRSPARRKRAHVEERAHRLAQRDIDRREAFRRRDTEAFESRLALMRDIPGWHYVRRGRHALLRGIIHPQERAFAYLLLHQKAIIHEVRLRGDHAAARGTVFLTLHWLMLGLPYVILRSLVWVQEKIYWWVTRSQRMLLRGAVVLPNVVQTGYRASRDELATRGGRAALRRAVLDEKVLNRRRRQALLFLAAIAMVLGWLLVELFVVFLEPDLVTFKRQTDLLFFYGAATRLFLPTPLEVVMPHGADVLGAVPAVVIAAAGSTLGSWLLFLLGMRINAGLQRWMRRRAWGDRMWDWLKREAPRYGYVLMGLILAIPFWPDSIAAIFAVLGLRLRWFLFTIFVATCVRLAAVLWLCEAGRLPGC